MSLTQEEMFYLATGLVDVNSWTGDQDCSRPKQRCAGSRSRSCRSEANSADCCGAPSMPGPSCATACSAIRSSSCSSTWSECRSRSSSSSSRSSCSSGWWRRTHPGSSHCHWRNGTTWSSLSLLLILALSLRVAEGCSSRSTPKPRPPPPPPIPSPAVRPNITFQTYACPVLYEKAYCLNNATCFIIKVGESVEYNCLCPDGYQGARCDFKSLDGTYMPHKEKMILERASIAGGATMAVVLVVILSVIFYTYVRQRRKEQRLSNTMDVAMDKLERRTRALSSCSSGSASCRCGKSFILLHQLAAAPLPSAAAASGNQGNQAKLAQVDARQAYRITSVEVAVDPTSVAHGHRHSEPSSGRSVHVALPVTDVSGLYRDVRTTPLADHTAVTLTEAKPNGGQL